MMVARTAAQLFRQLRAQDRPLAELELVRRAYDFGTPLHSARFEVDGTPFHVHGLGVASVTGQLGAPAHVVAAGVLHNVYTTGDWGDGRGRGPRPARRDRIRAGVDPAVEAVLTDLHHARLGGLLERAIAAPASLDEGERTLVQLELGDLYDKWEDGRIRYSLDGRSDRATVEADEAGIVALARHAGDDRLAEAFAAAFGRVHAEDIPPSLALGRRYSAVVLPLSARERPSVALRRWAGRAGGRLRGRADRG